MSTSLNTTEELTADLDEVLPGARSLYALAVEQGLWPSGDLPGFVDYLRTPKGSALDIATDDAGRVLVVDHTGAPYTPANPVPARLHDTTGAPVDVAERFAALADAHDSIADQIGNVDDAVGKIPTEKASSVYAQAKAAGYDGNAADFYASLVARDLPTDNLGRVASVPTDADGTVPLREQLEAVRVAAQGPVVALLESTNWVHWDDFTKEPDENINLDRRGIRAPDTGMVEPWVEVSFEPTFISGYHLYVEVEMYNWPSGVRSEPIDIYKDRENGNVVHAAFPAFVIRDGRRYGPAPNKPQVELIFRNDDGNRDPTSFDIANCKAKILYKTALP